MNDAVETKNGLPNQRDLEPNSQRFWRRNELAGLASEPRFHRAPYDPEELERWKKDDAREKSLLDRENAVTARYERIKESVTKNTNAAQDYVVVINRKDQPGEVEWSSPANLRETIGLAEEFLKTQNGKFKYTETDLYLRNAKDEKQTMTLADARATTLAASAASARVSPYAAARQDGLALSDLRKAETQQSGLDRSPQRRGFSR